MDSLVKTLVDNSDKTLKNLKKEIVGSDEILNIVNKIEENYPEEIENLEETLLDYYMGENDLKILKTGFPDK